LNYRCIKSAVLDSGRLSGSGYALGASEVLGTDEIRFIFPVNLPEKLSFVFGFRGAGNHYRCDFDALNHRLALSRIRDGIPVYLQHASVDLESMGQVEIRWCLSSIRLFCGDRCFLNLLAQEITDGHWGFATGGKSVSLPELTIQRGPAPDYRWIVLGDGYSNNRWKNRHFFSWPELAFGNKADYLNACVAAGNTLRVLEIVEQVGDRFRNSAVIVAAGADDFIEGVPGPETLDRLTAIVTRVRQLGAQTVHLCAIPPRARGGGPVAELNASVKKLSETMGASFIDFHSMLSAAKDDLIINGDYPGSAAQRIIATGVLQVLGLKQELSPLVEHASRPLFRGFAGRVALNLAAFLDRGLGRF
jgi:hypothetical protein